MRAQGAAAVVATTTSGKIDGNGESISELYGLPILDAAKVLVRLAAACTVSDLNSIANRALAFQISTLIAEDYEADNLLADLRARVLRNREHLAGSLLQRQDEGGDTDRCAHCGAPIAAGAP